jgi:hypothetical protein
MNTGTVTVNLVTADLRWLRVFRAEVEASSSRRPRFRGLWEPARTLAWLLFLLLMAPAARPAIFSTIITNGPTTNRVNLVMFSEGYTNGQLAAFLNDATNTANFFLSAEPYAEYSNYFNVFAIFTNSAHSGSTHLIYQHYVAGYTYFNSSYDSSSDYYITIPPNTVDPNPSHGQGEINSLLWTNYRSIFPGTNNNLPALLVNDPVDGGSDGGSSDYGHTAISSIGNVSYILVHESGHTLGGLGDEYTRAYPGYPTNDVEPNTTVQTNYSKIKWNAWISNSTPVPTPLTIGYETAVGLFLGAHYHTNGWYRPYENCCMQSFGVGFCPVCQQTLVRAIYAKARPMDSHSPGTNSLTVTSPTNLAFSLKLLQPATHNLNVQWRTNGVVVGGATSPALSLWWAQLGNGTNKVEADVWDATSMVLTDTNNVLKQTNVWTVKLAVPVMQFDSWKWLTNGSFSLQVTGSAPSGVVIQMSTNLAQWTPVQTSSLSGGKLSYTNSGATSAPRRFFRTETP